MAEDAQKAAQEFIRELWSLQGVSISNREYPPFAPCSRPYLTLLTAAQLVYTAESVMAHLVVAYWKGLANNAMADEQRRLPDPASEAWRLRVNGSKTHVVGLLLYTTLLWLLKACWLVYYARLTDGVHKKRRMIKWGVLVIGSTYVACLLVAFFKCIPFNDQWQINPAPGNRCMPAISSIQTIFVMVMNTLADFYLMANPIPVIWGSHLPRRKMFVLVIMFSGGFLEMAFGILRCASILTIGDIDPAQSG
ncbi:hypothetical protein DL765_005598 [Monosporascus sp. GIB2]|nr:hypothetical protein DL765_005598 [Monosporascus sp. GIB2]